MEITIRCLLIFYSVLGFGALLTTIIKLLSNKKDSIVQKNLSQQFKKPSLWSIGHFLLYYLIGDQCPNMWIFVIFTSVIWEIIEFRSKTYVGSWLDLIFNFSGYYLGYNIQIKARYVLGE